MQKILIINGPNLNLLGTRKPEVYGSMTLPQMIDELKLFAKEKGAEIEHFQSNHEGAIIDKLHDSLNKNFSGCLINAGAFTHYSYAIRDAIEAISTPCIEVHLSDIEKREDFRKHSVITEVCIKQFKGMGIDSYKKAIEVFI